MRTNRVLSYSESYISGFNDVYNHKSLRQTLIGLIKILSYCLIIPPIVSRCVYLKSKKIVDMQTDIDGKIDNGRIQEVFTQIATAKNNPVDGENKLINYLINKLENFETTDNEKLERSRFGAGFKKLSFASQKEFFKRANDCKCLGMALKWIPDDITDLNFISGPPNPILKSSMNNSNLTLLLEEIPRFTKLKTMHLHLRGLGFYTLNVDQSVYNMTQGKDVFACTQDSPCSIKFDGVTYYNYKNDTMAIVKAIIALRKLTQNQPDLIWAVNFMNSSLVGKGTAVLTMFDGDAAFLKNLTAYLKH